MDNPNKKTNRNNKIIRPNLIIIEKKLVIKVEVPS